MKAESAHTDTIRTGPSTTPACRNAQGSAKLPAPITAFRRWAEAASVLIFPWVGAMTALTIGLLVGCSFHMSHRPLSAGHSILWQCLQPWHP